MNFFKKTILLLILISQSLFSIDIKELSGSFSSINSEIQSNFSEQFKNIENSSYIISPILGAILFESEVIWNYYKFSSKGNPIGDLVKLLFHENQGAFLETSLPQNIAPLLNVELIGKIIGNLLKNENINKELISKNEYYQKKHNSAIYEIKKKIDSTTDQINENNNKLKQINDNIKNNSFNKISHKKFKQIHNLLFDKNKIKNDININDINYKYIINLFNKNLESRRNKTNDKKRIQIINNTKKPTETEIKTYIKLINENNINDEINSLKEERIKVIKINMINKKIKKLNSKLTQQQKSFDNNLNKFVTNLNNSLKKDKPYLGFFVLQALAYRKMNSKNDLDEYFKGVYQGLITDQDFNEKTKILISDDSVNEDVINKISEQLDPNNILKLFFNNRSFNPTEIDNFFVSKMLSYYLLGFPNIATYKGKTTYGTNKYPDCMETTLRNLLNIILYKNGKFQLKINENELKDTNIPNILSLYKKNGTTIIQTPTNVSNQAIHDKWAKIINNLNYIPYLRLAVQKNEKNYKNGLFVFVKNLNALKKKFNKNELIKFENETISINNKEYSLSKLIIYNEKPSKTKYRSYTIIDRSNKELENLVGYEINPSIETIYSFLSQSFYYDTNDKLETIFFSKKTQDKSLKLLKEFNIKYDNDMYPNFDKSFNLNLKKGPSLFKLYISYKNHGEINKVQKNKQKVINVNNNLPTNFLQYISVSGIEIPETIDNLDQYFYLLKLNEQKDRLELIEKINANSDDNDFKNFETLLVESLSFEADSNYIRKIIELVEKTMNQIFYKKAIEIATQAFIFNDQHIKYKAIELFKALIVNIYKIKNIETKDQLFNQAITAAYNYATKDKLDTYVGNNRIELLLFLVENMYEIKNSDIKQKLFEKASNIAYKEIEKHKDYDEYHDKIPEIKTYIEIFSQLIRNIYYEKDKDTILKLYKNTIKATLIGINHIDYYKNDFLYLSKLILVNILKIKDKNIKQKLLEEAIEITLKAIKKENSLKESLKQFKQLVKNINIEDKDKEHKLLDKAIKAASNGITDKDKTVINNSLKLFKALVKKGKAFKEAIEAALTGINSENQYIRESSIELFKLLFNNNKGFDEAIEAASTGINSENQYIRESSIELFKALVKKGKAFKEAIEAVLTEIKNKDHYIKRSSLELFKLLFNNNKGFDEAIEAASTGIKNKNEYIRKSSLKLFKALVKNKEGLNVVIKTASKDIINNNRDIRNKSLELFKLLFKIGQGFKEAIKITSTKMTNDKNKNIRITAYKLFIHLLNNLEKIRDEKQLNKLFSNIDKIINRKAIKNIKETILNKIKELNDNKLKKLLQKHIKKLG